jgi:lipoprotein-anchoring transpeptidase ErfK/SrfK
MTARPQQRRHRRTGLLALALGGSGALAIAAYAFWPAALTPVRASPPHTAASADRFPAGGDVGMLGLPDPVRPAFTPPRPKPLAPSDMQSAWAPVRRVVAAHARPAADSPVVTTIETKTPEQTDNVVLVLERRQNRAGQLWVKVRVPALPDNRTAWVERSALGGYTVVDTRLEVDLVRLTVTLYRAGRRIFVAPAGVGKPSWPTPTGHFYIRNKLTRFASPLYGPLAFGTSARSRVLTDWPGGGFIGIHGTNQPQLVPGRVSHGCIRLRNRDVLRLGELMPVGTPVTIT